MTPEETAKTYDALASHWDGEKMNQLNGLAQHMRALKFCNEKNTAIDVGCGSSGRFIDLLTAQGFAAEGLDISAGMLCLAKKKHPDIKFHQADICKWEFPRKYDFITAWDSIWHAPLEHHEAILRKCFAALEPEGVMIFTSGGVDEPEDGSNPFLGQPLYHAALGIPKLLEIISQSSCICRHLEYDQYPEKHLYLIVQAQPGV